MYSLPPTGSAVLVTPVSCAMICWVRSAMRADSSVGSASASSRELVCSDCAPPSTAAMACSAVRTMLTSGCCAVSVEPAVCTWKRSIRERGSLGAETVAHQVGVDAAGGAELGDLFQKIVVRVEEEGEARREGIDGQAGRDRRFDVGDGVGEGEGHFLHRGGAGFANVIAADRDGVPLRHLAAGPGEDVGDDAHGRARRIDIGAARDVLLQDVVLDGAGELAAVRALALRHQRVEGQQDRGGGVDGHRRGDVLQRDALEQALHVGQRGDRHADAAHFAGGQRVIAVVCPSGWADRRRRRVRWCLARAGSGSAGCSLRRCRSRRTGAWSRGGCGTCRGRFRGCRGTRRGSPEARS